jgi:hypothetical protein
MSHVSELQALLASGSEVTATRSPDGGYLVSIDDRSGEGATYGEAFRAATA